MLACTIRFFTATPLATCSPRNTGQSRTAPSCLLSRTDNTLPPPYTVSFSWCFVLWRTLVPIVIHQPDQVAKGGSIGILLSASSIQARPHWVVFSLESHTRNPRHPRNSRDPSETLPPTMTAEIINKPSGCQRLDNFSILARPFIFSSFTFKDLLFSLIHTGFFFFMIGERKNNIGQRTRTTRIAENEN